MSPVNEETEHVAAGICALGCGNRPLYHSSPGVSGEWPRVSLPI